MDESLMFEALMENAELPTMDDIVNRPRWMAFGECRHHPEVDFFPGRGEKQDKAVAVCNACVVMDECRHYALHATALLDGIWGGLSQRQLQIDRTALRKCTRNAQGAPNDDSSRQVVAGENRRSEA